MTASGAVHLPALIDAVWPQDSPQPAVQIRRVIALYLATSPDSRLGPVRAQLPNLATYLRHHHAELWLNPAHSWPKLKPLLLGPESIGIFEVQVDDCRRDVAVLNGEALWAASRAARRTAQQPNPNPNPNSNPASRSDPTMQSTAPSAAAASASQQHPSSRALPSPPPPQAAEVGAMADTAAAGAPDGLTEEEEISILQRLLRFALGPTDPRVTEQQLKLLHAAGCWLISGPAPTLGRRSALLSSVGAYLAKQHTDLYQHASFRSLGLRSLLTHAAARGLFQIDVPEGMKAEVVTLDSRALASALKTAADAKMAAAAAPAAAAPARASAQPAPAPLPPPAAAPPSAGSTSATPTSVGVARPAHGAVPAPAVAGAVHLPALIDAVWPQDSPQPAVQIRRVIALYLATSPGSGSDRGPASVALPSLAWHLHKDHAGLWRNPAHSWPKIKPLLLSPESRGAFVLREGERGRVMVVLDVAALRAAARQQPLLPPARAPPALAGPSVAPSPATAASASTTPAASASSSSSIAAAAAAEAVAAAKEAEVDALRRLVPAALAHDPRYDKKHVRLLRGAAYWLAGSPQPHRGPCAALLASLRRHLSEQHPGFFQEAGSWRNGLRELLTGPAARGLFRVGPPMAGRSQEVVTLDQEVLQQVAASAALAASASAAEVESHSASVASAASGTAEVAAPMVVLTPTAVLVQRFKGAQQTGAADLPRVTPAAAVAAAWPGGDAASRLRRRAALLLAAVTPTAGVDGAPYTMLMANMGDKIRVTEAAALAEWRATNKPALIKLRTLFDEDGSAAAAGAGGSGGGGGDDGGDDGGGLSGVCGGRVAATRRPYLSVVQGQYDAVVRLDLQVLLRDAAAAAAGTATAGLVAPAAAAAATPEQLRNRDSGEECAATPARALPSEVLCVVSGSSASALPGATSPAPGTFASGFPSALTTQSTPPTTTAAAPTPVPAPEGGSETTGLEQAAAPAPAAAVAAAVAAAWSGGDAESRLRRRAALLLAAVTPTAGVDGEPYTMLMSEMGVELRRLEEAALTEWRSAAASVKARQLQTLLHEGGAVGGAGVPYLSVVQRTSRPAIIKLDLQALLLDAAAAAAATTTATMTAATTTSLSTRRPKRRLSDRGGGDDAPVAVASTAAAAATSAAPVLPAAAAARTEVAAAPGSSAASNSPTVAGRDDATSGAAAKRLRAGAAEAAAVGTAASADDADAGAVGGPASDGQDGAEPVTGDTDGAAGAAPAPQRVVPPAVVWAVERAWQPWQGTGSELRRCAALALAAVEEGPTGPWSMIWGQMVGAHLRKAVPKALPRLMAELQKPDSRKSKTVLRDALDESASPPDRVFLRVVRHVHDFVVQLDLPMLLRWELERRIELRWAWLDAGRRAMPAAAAATAAANVAAKRCIVRLLAAAPPSHQLAFSTLGSQVPKLLGGARPGRSLRHLCEEDPNVFEVTLQGKSTHVVRLVQPKLRGLATALAEAEALAEARVAGGGGDTAPQAGGSGGGASAASSTSTAAAAAAAAHSLPPPSPTQPHAASEPGGAAQMAPGDVAESAPAWGEPAAAEVAPLPPPPPPPAAATKSSAAQRLCIPIPVPIPVTEEEEEEEGLREQAGMAPPSYVSPYESAGLNLDPVVQAQMAVAAAAAGVGWLVGFEHPRGEPRAWAAAPPPYAAVQVVVDPYSPEAAAMLDHCRSCTQIGLVVQPYGGEPALVALYAPATAAAGGADDGSGGGGAAAAAAAVWPTAVVYLIDCTMCAAMYGGDDFGRQLVTVLLGSLRGVLEDPAVTKVVHGCGQIRCLETACGGAVTNPLVDTRVLLSGLAFMLGLPPAPPAAAAEGHGRDPLRALRGELAAVHDYVSQLYDALKGTGLWSDQAGLLESLMQRHYVGMRREALATAAAAAARGGDGAVGGDGSVAAAAEALWLSRPLDAAAVAAVAGCATALPEVWMAMVEEAVLWVAVHAPVNEMRRLRGEAAAAAAAGAGPQ